MSLIDAGNHTDRVVARMRLFVKDGALEARKFEKVLASVPGGPAIRDEVVVRLEQAGVSLVTPASGRSVPGTEVAASDRFGSTPVALAKDPAGCVPISDAVAAARRVLETDRQTARPQRQLLSSEQEVGLAVLLRRGLPLDEPLSSGYRTGLIDGSEAAQAFDAFVIHNVRLVWSVARTYMASIASEGTMMDLDDLSQAGIQGLIRAVEMFDGSRGLKFSTYAINWIRQSISREIDNCARLIRLPVHVMEDIRKIRSASTRLRDRGERIESAALAALLELPESKIATYQRYMQGVVSLDKPAGDDGDGQLLEFMPAPPEHSPERLTMLLMRNEYLESMLWSLDERSASILKMRHGWEGAEPMTLDQIGEVFGVTRERIRQLEKKALERLRDDEMVGQLADAW